MRLTSGAGFAWTGRWLPRNGAAGQSRRTIATLVDDQRRLLLEVYQGEHSLCAQNQKLGQYELDGIPAGPAGTQVIAVRFTYDMNGVLDVDTTICSTGQTDAFTIE